MVMAVTPSLPFVSAAVATPTDGMRRDNQQREIITQVSQNEAFARESGLGTGADRAPLAGMASFANQLAGARQEAENIRRRARGEHSEKSESSEQLSDKDKEKVSELKERDAEVRRHEQTHASVGGQYAGSPKYETEQGPDGKSYAVAGSVDIDVAPIAKDPEATIQKMQTVKRAALAVDEPSAADRRIANEASRHEIKARQELASEQQQVFMPEHSQRIEKAYQGSFMPKEFSVFAQA